MGTLKSQSKLIAKRIRPVPHTIFRLFESVIEARKETHGLFCKFAGSNPDLDVQKSNESHLHWINGLVEAFNALGGDAWREENKASGTSDEDEDQVIFANAFSMLSLDGENKGEAGEPHDSDGSDDTPEITERNKPQSKQKPTKGGKKNKKGRKQKAKASDKKDAPEFEVPEIPLESYRIIDDETGTVTEYLMAVYSLTQQMASLRHELQSVWRQVAC